MKKKYTAPEMEITEFYVEDVITTSGNNDGTGEGGEETNPDEVD